MQCPVCDAVNRDGRKFCSRCGVSLTRHCPDCNFNNEHDAGYCGECGTALINDSIAGRGRGVSDKSVRPGAGYAVIQPERKQITVMFCDLVNSTELAFGWRP